MWRYHNTSRGIGVNSVTQILLVTGLPSASTILFNSTVTFNRSWCVNRNDIVKQFNAVLSVN